MGEEKSAIEGLYAVVTTIRPPTPSILALHKLLAANGGKLVVAGDKKGPSDYSLENCVFLSLSEQRASGFALAAALPVGHYARKNIGYLFAMQSGASCIYETDDDNTPSAGWQPRQERVVNTRRLKDGSTGWVNVYKYFTDDPNIWPRGLPLDQINCAPPISDIRLLSSDFRAPIQQGLVNGSPDVDAIWRLTQDREFAFEQRDPFWLAPRQWCPFNTQSTWWWPVAYPLLYIPSYCSFRMCDIWKSLIAQRCLWAMGLGVLFHGPEVVQDRNPHDLMHDFSDEVSGYLQNKRIADILGKLDLPSGQDAVSKNLLSCYEVLIAEGIFPQEEAALVTAWVEDVEAIQKSQ